MSNIDKETLETMDLDNPPFTLRSGNCPVRVLGKVESVTNFCYVVAVGDLDGQEKIFCASKVGVINAISRPDITAGPIAKEGWVNSHYQNNVGGMTMDPLIKQSITTAELAMFFIDALAVRDMLYHFDDEAGDCLRRHNLTEAQTEAIAHNSTQALEVDWTGTRYDCPFDYMISITKGRDNVD